MTVTETMRAERIHHFGGPEVLALDEIPRPEPGRREILVRVQAAGVNPVDWKIREGKLGRIPLPSIMGNDFSGTVEALGSDVEEFRVGQEVFGSVADSSGSYAEFAIAPVGQVAEKPPAVNHLQAAALPIAALTAWQALFDHANLQPGQQVLIHAAAGGVGGFGVQFAKWKGARVIGTASGRHIDYVRNLGADRVIDYHNQRFEDLVRELDVVLDTIGGETQQRSLRVLKPGGILVSLVQPPSQAALRSRGLKGLVMRCDHGRADQLRQIADLVASGAVNVHLDGVLPFTDAATAHELSQKGHTQGKIVLQVR